MKGCYLVPGKPIVPVEKGLINQRTDYQSSDDQGGSPTIFITDMARAVAFYTDILGLRLQYRAGDHFAMIDAGDGLSLGLHPPSTSAAAPGTPGSIQVGLNVCKPLAEVVETRQSRGVRFQQHGPDPIVEDGAVNLAFLSDPDGNALYLCETAQPL
ncbi:MAG: VOC family protein [Phycisphaerales bacterium]